MPRAPTSLSLSPGTLSQCRPDNVLDSEMTSEMGSELELPKTYSRQPVRQNYQDGSHTAIAMTKFFPLFLKPNSRETISAAT